MRTIGYTNGRAVKYSETTQTIGVYGTSIKLYGAKTRAEAVEQSKRNLQNFKEV